MKFSKILKIVFLFLVIKFCKPVFSQENTVVSGGDLSGSGGNMSYSIGQAIYTTSSGSTGTLSQGVQQPYDIYSTVGIDEFKGITLGMSIFPNPVVDLLVLKIENGLTENLSFNLYDEAGKIIENRIITTSETTFSMSQYMRAVYFLKVISNDNELKIFRIVKN